ncbi:hypothetical protein ACIBEK_03665 [Nocardia fusca]
MAAGVFALLAAPPEPGFGRVRPGLLLVGIVTALPVLAFVRQRPAHVAAD